MDFSNKLIRGKIVKYYKTFIVDIRLADDSIVAAFCPDNDFRSNLYTAGTEAWVSRSNDNKRKIRYNIEIINQGQGLVYVNPYYNKELFLEAFNNGILAQDFGNYTQIRCVDEVDGLEHIDFELSNENGEKNYIYIVDLYNKQGGYAIFPSVINFFELEMLEENQLLRGKGHKTTVFMIVPRQDCVATKFTWNLDPVSAAKIFDEAKKGLNFVCYGCIIDKKSITIANKLNILY